MSIDKHSLVTLSGPSITRFLVSTSDILEGGQKVYIRDEKTGDIRWCKTRTLTYNEIVDELHSPEPESALKYTIHRPTRGWYIHVRAHSSLQSRRLPPIALTPDPLADPDSPDADSELMIQLPDTHRHKGKQRASGLEDQDEYSFPPTPPTIRSPPPSGRRIGPQDTSVPSSASSSTITLPSEPKSPLHTDPLRSPDPGPLSSSKPVTLHHPVSIPTIPLVFAPIPAPSLPQKQPVFSRAYASGFLRVVANTLFSPPRRSFVLSSRNPMRDSGPLGTELRSTQPLPTPVLEAGPRASTPRVPVLIYTDTTPVFSISQMTGVLTVDLGALGIDGEREEGEGETSKEGPDVGLLVTAAMAYLDYLGDREGYFAAANGG